MTCTAERELPPGASIGFIFRLLAGPKSESGTITGTARAGTGQPVAMEVPLTITPKR